MKLNALLVSKETISPTVTTVTAPRGVYHMKDILNKGLTSGLKKKKKKKKLALFNSNPKIFIVSYDK